MSNKKIIFMGTPLIAVDYLRALINNNIEIESIFTHFMALISSNPNFFVSPNFIFISVVLAVILSKPRILIIVLLY